MIIEMRDMILAKTNKEVIINIFVSKGESVENITRAYKAAEMIVNNT